MNALIRQLEEEISTISNEERPSFLMEKLKCHDYMTFRHSVRVSQLLFNFATELKLPKETLHLMLTSALLHDIGKLGIDQNLLKKQSGLTSPQWETLKKHVVYGDYIVKHFLTTTIDQAMILQHHENLDGSGYIFGSKEKELGINVRMLRIVDSFEAMTATRPYSNSKPIEGALEELKQCKGIYDQQLVEAFNEFFVKRMKGIRMNSLEFTLISKEMFSPFICNSFKIIIES